MLWYNSCSNFFPGSEYILHFHLYPIMTEHLFSQELNNQRKLGMKFVPLFYRLFKQLWSLNSFRSQVSVHSSAGEALVRRGERLLVPLPPRLQPSMPSQVLRTHVYPLHTGSFQSFYSLLATEGWKAHNVISLVCLFVIHLSKISH